jgi:hypothetical protein
MGFGKERERGVILHFAGINLFWIAHNTFNKKFPNINGGIYGE